MSTTSGDLAIVECEGRIIRSEAAFKLRDAVTAQVGARTVVVELTEVKAIEDGGLGVLVFLQRWAHDHNIRLKLFNPSKFSPSKAGVNQILIGFRYSHARRMMTLLDYAGYRMLRLAEAV